ncbi:protein of unknown function [Hyphomicrobium sp. MC1]|nr:protein of unknown function [Hyphomicrobium sp. MC1]
MDRQEQACGQGQKLIRDALWRAGGFQKSAVAVPAAAFFVAHLISDESVILGLGPRLRFH